MGFSVTYYLGPFWDDDVSVESNTVIEVGGTEILVVSGTVVSTTVEGVTMCYPRRIRVKRRSTQNLGLGPLLRTLTTSLQWTEGGSTFSPTLLHLTEVSRR